jgi:hypothetical protein
LIASQLSLSLKQDKRRKHCTSKKYVNNPRKRGAPDSMDYLEKVLEKVKEWARKLVEILLGPEAEPEPELMPIPVDNPRRSR